MKGNTFIHHALGKKGEVLAVLLIGALVSAALAPLMVARADHDGSLYNLSNQMSNQTTEEASDHDISFTNTNEIGDDDDIVITFDADFDLTSIVEDDTEVGGFDYDTFTVDGQDIIFGRDTAASATPVSAETPMNVKIGTNATSGTNQIVNPNTEGTYDITIDTQHDTGVIAVTILDDGTVFITADVDQSITFTIEESALSFGTLSADTNTWATTTTGATEKTVAHAIQAGTNASSGYTVTLEGPTLTSAGNDTIAAIGGTAEAPGASDEQFGLNLEPDGGNTGSGSVESPFGTTDQYAFQADTVQDVLSATGPTATDDFDVHYLARIAADTPAGNYSTALVYVATANF